MANRKCSFVSKREKLLHDKYKAKYPDDKDIHLQIFNNRISILQSDPNRNFNYVEMMNNGQEDAVLEAIHETSKEAKKKAAEESLVLPEYSTDNNKATSMSNVVSISEDKDAGLLEFNVSEGSLTMEEVEDIVSKFINANNFNTALASNLRNNIKSLAELKAFALYLAENEYYNNYEDAGNKFSYEQLVSNAMRKLNSYAQVNSAIAEIRTSYREANKPTVDMHKGIVQMSDFKKNGYISTNDVDEASNTKDAYGERTRANAQENSDATIIICPWNADSPGEKLTRKVASAAENNGVSKIAADVNSKSRANSVDGVINYIIKHLESREDLNLEDGIILNIAGNAIDKIVAAGQTQDMANRYVYRILKGLQDRGIKINQIVTGGQTGVDEAGIIAAAALGIPYRLHVAAIRNKWGKVTYPLRLENDENGNQQNGFYSAGNSEDMNKFLNRFNKESINKLKGNRQAPKAQEGVKNASQVQTHKGYWSREEVQKNQDKVYLFGDNTDDRLNTHHVPTSTQAVIRGLPNAIGIDTKKDRGTKDSSYFTDEDFDEFKKQVDSAIEQAKNSGKTIVLPEDGIGTGKAMLKEKAPKLYNYLQQELNKLKNNQANQPSSRQASTDITKALQQFAQAANNLAAALGGQPIDTSLDVASQEEKSNAQDLMQEQQEKLFEESKVEEKKIKQSITDVKSSPLAKLHRAIGKNAPQIVTNRMNMFAMRFSQIVDGLVDTYKEDQWNKSQDTSLSLEERERAYYNYTKADDPEGGRQFVISKTGNIVLDMMKESFQDEADSLDGMLENGEITEEEFNYRKNQWQIVQDHFNTLFDLSSTLIERNEGIKIKGKKDKKGNIALTIDKSSQQDEIDNENNEDNDEGNIATGNDGWVFKTREVDPHTRMSQAVKKLLRNISKRHLAQDGYISDTDDLGQDTYWQEDQLYAILVKEFSKVKEPIDFCVKTTNPDGTIEYEYPIFDGLGAKYTWISDVIDMLDQSLEPDPITGKVSTQTISLFYSNFRNDFIPYYMSSKGNSKALNLESASQSTLDVAISNFEHGNIFGTHSIYNTSAGINMDNVKYWGEKTKVGKKTVNKISEIRKFIDDYNDLDSTEEEDDKQIKAGINDIVDLLGSIGLPYSHTEIEGFIETDLGRTLLKKAISEANAIVTGLIKNPDNTNITDTYKKNYRNIGKHLDKIYEEYVQQSFREGDKTRYSYSTPNYIDTMVKFLNQTDMEKRHEYMLDTYGQYQWFYKDGEWQNEILQRLWDGEEVAFSDIKDMPIINSTGATKDKHEYMDWTPADISGAFFAEFMQNNDSDNEVTKHTAFYNFPIFSDSPICKLVKMMRYTGDSTNVLGSNHRSQILPKLVKIAEQELWRINLVRERRKQGVEEIVNFDSKGSKFCFFPALNKMTFETLMDYVTYNPTIVTLEDQSLRSKLGNRLAETGNSLVGKAPEIIAEDMRKQYEQDYKESLAALAEATGKSNPSLMELLEQAIEDDNDSLKQDILKMAIQETVSYSEEDFINKNDKGLAQGIQNLIASKKLDDRRNQDTPELGADLVDLYMNEVSEYFWNSYLATANIIEMTTTDLAFYKNGVNFQKRYKQVYASGTKLNTQSKYGKQYENTLYLRDNVMTVPTYDYLKRSLQEAVNNKDLHESEMKAILSTYRDITQTDAQAFRSVKSVRDVLDMLGQLTPALEDMFDRMLDKEHPYEYKYSDFNSLIQTIKPFFFGHDTIDSGIANAGMMRVPHQNKNSEFTLLSSVGAIAAIMQNSAQLSALNNWMIANDVDVVQFESAVKIGGQGITDVNWSPSKVQAKLAEINDEGYYVPLEDAEDLKKYYDEKLEEGSITSAEYNKIIRDLLPDYNEVIDILNDRALNEDGSLKPEVVHQHSYDDYMIATATPEHFFDTEAIYGSQFRNLIISDIQDSESYVVNGKTYSGSEIKEHYRKLVTENLLESFGEVKEKFGSLQKLQEKLKGMIAGNPRYGDDMLDALEIVKDKDGNDVFNIPLHNPSTTNKIQELLNSLWKTTVTKQKIKGGAGILVTDFGFSDTLQVVRNEDGSIKEIECYMPVYSKKFYEKYLKDDGTLDFARMERECPDLLRIVGTRIPTEGKYSMLNLKIKGFLPQINGGAVMLPAEITQTAGSDFDVDKIFIQFPEFQVVEKYNIIKAWDSFYKLDENKDIVEEIDKNLMTAYLDYIEKHPEDADISVGEYVRFMQDNGFRKYNLSETASKRFGTWFKNHRSEFITGRTYEKIRYDESLGYSGNSRAARNNEMIDIATSILSNKAQSVHFSNPGSFNKIKRIAKVSEIVEDENLLNNYMKLNNLKDKEAVKKHIMNAKLKDLDSFLKEYATERDILSPQTFIYNHQQNMTGAKLIGMYANNNSMQAKFQGTGLSLKERFSFEVNGRTIRALNRMKTDPVGSDQVTELISKNCAEWLAASVDNVNDPVLAKLLQNPNTANVAGFLLRAGLTIDEVGLFFRHPAVRFLIENSLSSDLNRKDVKKSINHLLSLVGSALNTEENYSLDSDNILDNMMSKSDTVMSVILSKENEDISKSLSEEGKKQCQEWYNMYSLLYNKILPAAETLGEMTRCCRADSPNGAIARTLPMALNQRIRLDNFWSKSMKREFPLEDLGAMPSPSILEDNGLNAKSSIDDIRKVLYDSGEGLMLQAFTTLGITAPIEIMSEWFKPFQKNILDMVSDVVRNHDNKYGTVNDDVMNTIFSDFTTYVLSKTAFFGNDGESTFEEKRNWYLYEFPKQFLEISAAEGGEYEALRNLEIMKKLRVVKGEIVLRTGGALTSTTKQLLKQSMDTLLYMDSPVAEQLATDLFAYAYYSKGFNFDAFDYAQFFSTTFLTTVGAPVIDALRNYDVTSSDIENFKEQLYMNRLNALAPYLKIKDNENIKILDKKNSRIEVPLGYVYNDHMDDIESKTTDGRTIYKSSVFPKLSTDFGYYIVDTSRGDEDGIDLARKVVYYKYVNRFRPETLGDKGNRQWSMYDASQSAEEMANKYVVTKQQRDSRLEELKKINSSFRKKANGKSRIKSKVGKAEEYNTYNDLSEEDKKVVSNIDYTQVNMANEEDITSVSGMSDAEAAAAIEYVQTFDASEDSDDVADITGFSEESSTSAYIQAASTMDITQSKPSELADSGAVGLANKTDISKEDFEPTGDDFNNRCPQKKINLLDNG